MKIIPLHEGAYAVDKQKTFTPIALGEALPKGSLKMGICPFLIILENDVVLLDAGLGFSSNGLPMIHSLLKENGYAPENITKVLLSHLHKDHIDGLGNFNDGKFEANFGKAKIYLQKRELDYALRQTDNPSFDQKMLLQLKDFSNLVLLSENEGWINDEIYFEVTGGHSPFHQAFWIREKEEIAFYGADNLPQKAYLNFNVAYKTDDDGKKAMLLRQKWEQLATEESWNILFYHDIKNNVQRF